MSFIPAESPPKTPNGIASMKRERENEMVRMWFSQFKRQIDVTPSDEYIFFENEHRQQTPERMCHLQLFNFKSMTRRRVKEKCWCNKVSPRAQSLTKTSIIHALLLCECNQRRADTVMRLASRAPNTQAIQKKREREGKNGRKICSNLVRESGSNFEWYGCHRTKWSDAVRLIAMKKKKIGEMILMTKSSNST